MEIPNQKPKQHSKYPKQQQQEETFFTCEICIEPVTLNNKFMNNNKCVHPFCTDCIAKYIQLKLQDDYVSGGRIQCPAITCNHSLEPLSCRPNITRQIFDKWCDALCESTVLGVVHRVYCPDKECLELILMDECNYDDRNDITRCVCPGCKKPFCFRCKVPWHDGSTCEETVRDENDVAFELLYKENKWMRCPRCGHCVERTRGCKSIVCRCTTEFCYKYGKQRCYHRIHEDPVLGPLVFLGPIIALVLALGIYACVILFRSFQKT